MKILFTNTIFFQQKKGGVSRYFINLANELALLKKNFRIIAPFSKNIYLKNFIKNKIKGSVVNICSIVGQIGFNELSVYASSKGALASLTKSFAVEMAPYNIRANIVSPGFTKTSYYKKFKIKKKEVYNWTLSRIPMKRWGEASEISDLIIYLLSEKSSYITGENINIDGGWLNS